MGIRKNKYCTKSIEGILNDCINIKHLESQKPSTYDHTYPPMLKYFKRISQQDKGEWLTCGAHQAYIWMPKRVKLKLHNGCKDCALSSLCEIKNHKGKYFPQDDNIIEWQLKSLRSFINGSIVGTSKFLHFSFPKVFPIWDSRVAKAIGFSTSILHNKTNDNDIKHYVAYARSIHEICADYKDLVKSLDIIPVLAKKKPLRKVEQALFLIGGKK